MTGRVFIHAFSAYIEVVASQGMDSSADNGVCP